MGCISSSPVEANTKFHENYKLGKKLGEGAFGQVRTAKSRVGDQDLAVKIIDARGRDMNGEPTKQADAERVQVTLSEIKVWQAVGVSDHCVALQGSYFERNLFYMVMEKCEYSLMDKLSKMSTMMEADLCRIFSEMLLGIKHVHEKRIVHRDIKPDNFLFGGSSGSTVKLCDFGLAAQLPQKGKLKGIYGTAPYMSPEMLGSTGYDEKIDIWSLGATAFLMIHGDFPYVPKEATAPAMKKCIVQGRPEIHFVRGPEESTFFSRPFVDRATPFLQALLQRAPATRKTADEALALPFLAVTADPSFSNEAIIAQSEGGEDAVMAPAFRKARKATLDQKEFRRQPIKQKGLEDLLELWLAKNGGEQSEGATTFFSEGDENIEHTITAKNIQAEKSEDRIHRRSETRFGTHSGTVGRKSGSAIDIEALRGLDFGDYGPVAGGGDEALDGKGGKRPSKSSPSTPSRQPSKPEPAVCEASRL
mmetsp:Transcript_34160/g.88836  ORF Transcript_34160/g.88836 Transcript_34160/m.88836 type:complete len:476 (+) Transcript_34160:151-1578(+)